METGTSSGIRPDRPRSELCQVYRRTGAPPQQRKKGRFQYRVRDWLLVQDRHARCSRRESPYRRCPSCLPEGSSKAALKPELCFSVACRVARKCRFCQQPQGSHGGVSREREAWASMTGRFTDSGSWRLSGAHRPLYPERRPFWRCRPACRHWRWFFESPLLL